MHLPEKDTLIIQDLDWNKWEIQMGKNSRPMIIHHYCASKNHKRYMDFCAWDGIKLYHYKTSSSSSRFWCFKDNSIEYNPKFPGIKSSNGRTSRVTKTTWKANKVMQGSWNLGRHTNSARFTNPWFSLHILLEWKWS